MRLALALAVALVLVPAARGATALSVTPASPDTDAQVQFHLATNSSVSWDFGDGNTSRENPASHRFALAGLYTIHYRLANGTAGSIALLVRIPDRLYVDPPGNHSGRPHQAGHADGLLVSQPWIIPLLVLALGGGGLAAAHLLLQRRRKAEAVPEPDADPEMPVEPESPPELDLDAYVPLPAGDEPSAPASPDSPPPDSAE